MQRQSSSFEYLIVGGGNAAGYACRELVAQGVAPGSVAMMVAEPVLPYERPALTKAYLHPPSAKVRARLPGFHTCVGGGGERQTPEWYQTNGISILNGKATDLDLASKTVLSDQQEVKFGKCILATGCGSIKVSQFGVQGDDLKNVFYIREESDAAALVKALESLNGKGKAVIVGGGYIGLECAAAIAGWGLETTMIFPEDHVMPRLFNSELGKWMEDEYKSRGIKILKGDVVGEFNGKDGSLAGVTLKSGEKIECDISVVGVGASPNIGFCKGLDQSTGGIKVDSNMTSSNPNVYAIGDIAAFPSKSGDTIRVEHVVHARESASQAVKAALGVKCEPYMYTPYFYSRIFEYTDNPIVFNFYGDQSGEIKVSEVGAKSIGAVWIKDGKAVGALLLGSPGPSGDDAKKLAQIAADTPEATDVATAFASVGL